ncbi:hypothetical protein K2X05_09550 [bacterium]|nr:hypothetical protein [bacterium]
MNSFFFYLLFNLCQAQTFYLGGNLGFTDANGPYEPKEVAVSYGGRLGWLFYEHVGFGVLTHFYQANRQTESIGYVPLLAEVSFYPFKSPLDSSAFFISGLFGTTKIVYDLGSTQGTNNQTTFGVAGGYGIFVDPRYSIGPEFQYLFIFDNQTYSVWSALFSVRVWF